MTDRTLVSYEFFMLMGRELKDRAQTVRSIAAPLGDAERRALTEIAKWMEGHAEWIARHKMDFISSRSA